MTGVLLVLLGALLALAATPAEAAAALYATHCAVCHGDTGKGDGPAMGALHPRPRDFTTGAYKFRSTPSGTLPTVEDVVRSTRVGLAGTSMPGYEGILSPAEIESVSRAVLAMAPQEKRPGKPISLGLAPQRSPDIVARGRALFTRSGCAACHGPQGKAVPWRPAREDPGGAGRPTALTEPWTFRGGSDRESVTRRILTGIDGSSMPPLAGRLAPPEVWAIASYVDTLARTPAWQAADPATVRTVGISSDPVDRGRYLVRATQCMLCHTPISAEDGAYDTALYMAGGMRVSAYPWGVWYSRNITSDEETGIGRWTEDELVLAVTRGIARDGRRLHPMAMSWPWFSRLTESDARAIAAYLKRLPVIRNPVPLPEPVPLAEAAGGRLLHIFGAEVALEFWGGNAASDPALQGDLAAPPGRRSLAITLGWGSLALPLVAFAVGLRRRRRWAWSIGAAVGLLGWGLLAVWPPVAVMSPEVTTEWLLMGTPGTPTALGGSRRALVERGEYLATVAPCGLCHTPVDALVGFRTSRTLAGGMEARWKVYGSQVSTNLTPHEDGIASTPDATILRAMRSGIGKDGRRMHWQAMSWDILSNWTEEDQRAMIAYLRTLPAVAGRVPAPRGPRPGDPPAAAFLFGDRALR
jgi:mono/diheme cytochrome c family protein